MKAEMNEELSKFGRLAEIAAAPSKLDPIIESFVRSINAEVEKLPTPPPGYYYAPVDFQFKREGDNYTVEGEIGLRPIIEPIKYKDLIKRFEPYAEEEVSLVISKGDVAFFPASDGDKEIIHLADSGSEPFWAYEIND